MNNELEQSHTERVIGNYAPVTFVMFNKAIEGKIDTGATTSSLHASNIQTDKSGTRVSFVCEELSPNVITLEMDGAQEVHSADNGGDVRPTVKFDIEINGVLLKGMTFNLNDRSKMDSPLLVGQNILQSGHFVIDVKKDSEPEQGQEPPMETVAQPTQPRIISEDEDIVNAIEVLRDKGVTFDEIFRYLTTKAQHTIENLEP